MEIPNEISENIASYIRQPLQEDEITILFFSRRRPQGRAVSLPSFRKILLKRFGEIEAEYRINDIKGICLKSGQRTLPCAMTRSEGGPEFRKLLNE